MQPKFISWFLRESKNLYSTKVPLFIESKIQECAQLHLNVEDMGKLRDRLDGMAYYERLREDILAELAFEELLGLDDFDWEKRKAKRYQRKFYVIDNIPFHLISFPTKNFKFPLVEVDNIENAIFICSNSKNKVFICGLASKEMLKKYGVTPSFYSPMTGSLKEFRGLDQLMRFNSKEELVALLQP